MYIFLYRSQGRRMSPNHSYKGHALLSMWSGYLVQLPYYTAASFNDDATYNGLFHSHWQADWQYYNDLTHQGQRGRYGLGAGTTPRWCTGGSGYYADRINQGSSHCRMMSPYITAGYMPNDPATISRQLLEVMEDGDTTLSFTAPKNKAKAAAAAAGNGGGGGGNSTEYHVMWRSSMLDYTWSQGYGITMVDFSSELFGLSTLFLEDGFFRKYAKAPSWQV